MVARGRNPSGAARKAQQAVRKYNSAVRKYNSEAKRYNREAKRFNRQQRVNRSRLEAEIREYNRDVRRQRSALSSSTTTLYESYEGLRHVIDDDADGGGLVDLAAGEAAASLRVLGVVERDEPRNETSFSETSGITTELSDLSTDLDERWRGALFSLSPNNPDAARHFCTSAREVIVRMIDEYAPDDVVLQEVPDCELFAEGKPSRRAKVQYLVYTRVADSEEISDFVDADISDVLGLFRVFNSGTHGSAGHFDIPKLISIKERVEGAIVFLSRLLR